MGTYIDLQNREEWNKATLDVLEKFDAVCSEHDIPWFLEGGSALGAIRHRGFIPWDNDIDISLLEEDYQRLREVYLSGGFPAQYVLQDNETDPNYPVDFSRFVDTSATALLRSTSLSHTPWGVQIDVFRLMPVSDNEEEREQARTRYLVLGELIHPFIRRCGHRSKEFWSEYNKALREIETDGREAVLKRRKEEFYASGDVSSQWLLLGSSGSYNGYPFKRRSWYQQPVKRVLFEGYEWPVPAATFRMLRQHYGESFRQYPSQDEAWSPVQANGNVPEAVIRKTFMQLYNYEELKNDLMVEKERTMELAQLHPQYSIPVHTLRAELALLKMRDALKQLPNDCAEKVWKALCSSPEKSQGLAREIFGEDDSFRSLALSSFIATIFDKKYEYWHLSVPIEPTEFILCAGFLLLRHRPYWEVRRLALRTSLTEEKSDERVQNILLALDTIDEILLLMDEERFLEVDKLLEEVENTFPSLREVAQAQMWLASRAKTEKCLKRALKRGEAASLVSSFVTDGDILCLYADYFWSRKRKRRARKYYIEAIERTTNGLTLLHCKDRLAGDVR